MSADLNWEPHDWESMVLSTEPQWVLWQGMVSNNHLIFFCMAYLNAWLTSFVGYTLLCSLLGWTTRGRHHSPVSVCLTVWPLHQDFSLLFCEKWSGFFYVHSVWLSYTRDRRRRVSSERLGNEDKTPCQRALPSRRNSKSCGNLQYGSSQSIHWCLDCSATTAPHHLIWYGIT